MMLERVSRQPDLDRFYGYRSAEPVAPLLAWAPVVDAVAAGTQVGLSLIDRALVAIFRARRAPSETEAGACTRLMRQDPDVRTLLVERGLIVGKPIQLPKLESVQEPVPDEPANRSTRYAAVALATGAVRRHVYALVDEGEGYLDAKHRLMDAGDPELLRLQSIVAGLKTENRK